MTVSGGALSTHAAFDRDLLPSPDGASAQPAPSYDVLGVPVTATSLAEATSTISRWVRNYRKGERARYVCVADVHAVMQCRNDPAMRQIYERAALVTPDGMPLVWLGHLFGHRQVTRVYGPDLMLALCRQAESPRLRHFFYGGGEGVAELLARKLREQMPDLAVAGTFTPPFRPLTEAERSGAVRAIEAARPDIVWVGLGAPKQERWMSEMAPQLRVPIMIGVGAAFDFLAGIKPQAPLWMRRRGMEWLFRLRSEPRRLWKRYAASVGTFPWLIAAQLLLNHRHGIRQLSRRYRRSS